MLSQLFIMASRGNTLAFCDYTGEFDRTSCDIFQRQLPTPPPVLEKKSRTFVHVHRSGLYFVGVTTRNCSPLFLLEFLDRVVTLCKDFCGELSEFAVQANSALVYEILDETVGFGVPQESDTLRHCIFNVPTKPRSTSSDISVLGVNLFGLPEKHRSVTPQRSVVETRDNLRNEIYVDITERLDVLISPQGDVIHSAIDGRIVMKNFVHGSGDLHIDLNENVLTRDMVAETGTPATNSIVLDEYTLHESIDFDVFNKYRKLCTKSTMGERTLMTYRIADNPKRPLRLNRLFEKLSNTELRLHLKLYCELPVDKEALSIKVRMNPPREMTRLTYDKRHSVEHNEKRVEWTVDSLAGGRESACALTFTLDQGVTSFTEKEIGPITLSFEVSSHLFSNMQINFLKVYTPSQTTPKQWFRYVTHSDSYVYRI